MDTSWFEQLDHLLLHFRLNVWESDMLLLGFLPHARRKHGVNVPTVAGQNEGVVSVQMLTLSNNYLEIWRTKRFQATLHVHPEKRVRLEFLRASIALVAFVITCVGHDLDIVDRNGLLSDSIWYQQVQ